MQQQLENVEETYALTSDALRALCPNPKGLSPATVKKSVGLDFNRFDSSLTHHHYEL